MVKCLTQGYLAIKWQSWAEGMSSGFQLPGLKSELYHLLAM